MSYTREDAIAAMTKQGKPDSLYDPTLHETSLFERAWCSKCKSYKRCARLKMAYYMKPVPELHYNADGIPVCDAFQEER